MIADELSAKFCSSVYIVSASTRCRFLATELMQRVYPVEARSPPPRPPLPASPPPRPPPPPSPEQPEDQAARLWHAKVEGVMMSTFFVPAAATEANRRALELHYGPFGDRVAVNDVGLVTSTAIREQLVGHLQSTHSPLRWANCAPALSNSPLPCRTGATEATCLDGARACSDVMANTLDPYVSLYVQAPPPEHALLFVRVTLPTDPIFARLLFSSPQQEGGRGYELHLFDHRAFRLPCKMCTWERQPVQDYVEGLQHLVVRATHPLITDKELRDLTRVREVRVVLAGELRQVWIGRVEVVFFRLDRSVLDTADAPSPPPAPDPEAVLPFRMPSPPSAPPHPHEPVGSCQFYEGATFTTESSASKQLVDCHVDSGPQHCCQMVRHRRPTSLGYSLTFTGCCYAWHGVDDASIEHSPATPEPGLRGVGLVRVHLHSPPSPPLPPTSQF